MDLTRSAEGRAWRRNCHWCSAIRIESDPCEFHGQAKRNLHEDTARSLAVAIKTPNWAFRLMQDASMRLPTPILETQTNAGTMRYKHC